MNRWQLSLSLQVDGDKWPAPAIQFHLETEVSDPKLQDYIEAFDKMKDQFVGALLKCEPAVAALVESKEAL